MALTSLPDFTDGVLTAAKLQQLADAIAEMRGRLAYKTGTETIISNSAFQNDDDLFLSIETNAVYLARVHVIYTSGATPDFKIQATVPAGTTTPAWTFFLQGNINDFTPTAGLTGIAGSGTVETLDMSGLVITSTTPGVMQWQWAQNLSDATNTSVGAGSFFSLDRML